ncbi:sensor histidine kinase [Rhizohabitans arisaemae]|uniref:sensor histidine kinase n=1 Tax=Rhizohabitans arisaemae TaxID=2720610 RepID=UPI0024B06DD3|nr:histidine kinase [Rhizohabitans arisaemae]
MFEPVVGLLVNAATGLAAWPLLVLLGIYAGLTHLTGLDRRPLDRLLGMVHTLAGFQHGRAVRVLDRHGAGPYRPDGIRREVGWLAVHSVAGPACLILLAAFPAAADVIWNVRVVEPDRPISLTFTLSLLALMIAGWMTASYLHTAQARLAHLMLGCEPSLAERVRELTESRAAAVDTLAAELRRIERDLHDGAQARLIAMRMSLGMIKGEKDPDRMRELAGEAWESAGQALADLRHVVRGIHPPVLADRGLAGAIQATALLCPVPVEVDIVLPARPAAPVESAMYFAAAEALTNVAKHSGAGQAWVRLRHSAGMLRLTVGDDGRGGADPARGTGLDGIRSRLSAFDGRLKLDSPPEGSTELTMELPCVL